MITFSNKGEVNFAKIEEGSNLRVVITKNFKTLKTENDEMYDSDEEADVYLSSLKNQFYNNITSNENYIAFNLFEKVQMYCFNLRTEEIFMPVGIDNRHVFVTMTKILSKDRLFVCYDNNKFLIHDLNEKNLVKFSKKNMKNFPINYLNQYNRIYGIVELETEKLLLYTHFTHILVDLNAKIPDYSKIVKNHPSKTDTRVMNWNESLAFHNKKYLAMLPHHNFENSRDTDPHPEIKSENFKIENKYKGIL